MLEEKKVAPCQSSVVVIPTGPKVDAQEVRIPPYLLPKRVGPGEPGRLPLAPGRIRGRPPGDACGPLVERRGRERASDEAARPRRGLGLFCRLLRGFRRRHGFLGCTDGEAAS